MTVHKVHYTPKIHNHAETVSLIFCDVYGPERHQDSAIIMKLCRQSNCFGAVSFDADHPVGFILLQLATDTADVIELCVRASMRRKGIGRHLMEQALHLASAYSLKRVMLEVEATNKTAYKLYRSFGFEVVGKRPNYYQRRSETADALVLEFHLG